MSFLRRLLGGGSEPAEAADGEASDEPAAAPSPADLVAEEQARERDLLRADAERMSDDLIQRQMRYANRSWTPPAQGGTRRADDEDASRE